MKKILVIGAGWEQEHLIRTAKERGWWVLATAWPSSYADALTLADETAIVDPRDLPAVWQFAQGKNLDGVIADQCDYSYFAAAYVADRMSLPGPSLSAAQVATNKYQQREALTQSEVLQPKYQLCTTLPEVQAALEHIGYPAMLKPLDNRGNFGVNCVEGPEGVPEAYFEAIANSHSRNCLVEQFIEGTMTSVEGFMLPNGKHVSMTSSSKVMLGGQKRVAMELRFPAEFDQSRANHLRSVNQHAMQYLSYGVGPTHAEYIVTPDGEAYFIEAANRGGGVLINSHIVPSITGVDTTALMLDHAIGEPLEATCDVTMQRAAVLSFFGLQVQGTVTAIRGVDAAQKLPGVVEMRMLVREGSIVDPITTDANRHGFVIAESDDLQSALHIVSQAKEIVQVECT